MTYGGKPILEPNSVARELAKDSAFSIMRGWRGAANYFSCPLGDQPGMGLVLMRLRDIIDLDLDNVLEYDLKVSDQYRTQTIVNLHPLQAWCISPGTFDDPASIYAVQLADRRFYLRQQYVAKAYNVRRSPGGGWITDTLDATGSGATSGSPVPWSWYRLGEDIWDELLIDDAWPGWPADYTPDAEPTSWHFWQVPTIEAFQAVARRLGCSIRWHPFLGTFDIVQLGADDAAFQASIDAFEVRSILWDEAWHEPWPHKIPETVRVIFRRLLAEDNGNPYEVRDVAFPDAAYADYARAGSVALVYDDLIYDATNGTALTTRATQRADDYARIVTAFNPNIYRHYRGVGTAEDVFIGSLCSKVTWQDIGHGTQTVIESSALDVVEYDRYWHGVGEVVTEARCVGNDIEETLLTAWWGKPIRFS